MMNPQNLKILIPGASGMLAGELLPLLEKNSGYDVIAAAKKDLNIADKDAVMDAVAQVKPDVIINCAAFTDVEACEDKDVQKLAMDVNAKGPKNLAIAAKANNCRLIHISTDYVFNKHTSIPIEEHEETNPCNFYGKTKAMGEKYISENTDDYLILRTSWLYGHGGKNFITTIINAALNSKEDLNIINDQFGRPTYAYDLAKMIVKLINFKECKILNVSNNGRCCWYELAKTALEYCNIKHKINPVSSEKFITKATRPKYSVLSLKKLAKEAAITPRNWEDALKDYIDKETKE